MNTAQAQDIDLQRLLALLRKMWLPILGIAALLALLAFLYSNSQARTYQATATLAALPIGNPNTAVNTALVSAPAVPPQVLDGVLRSPRTIQFALDRLKRSVPAASIAEIKRDLLDSDGLGKTVYLQANVDQQQVGIYSVVASSHRPYVAQQLANAFAAGLLDWDKQRALQSVNTALKSLQTQSSSLAARIAGTRNATDQNTLLSARALVSQQIDQLILLSQTVTGTLTPLSQATLPVDAVAPKPLRNAVLTFAASLFFGVLIASLLDRLQRRVESPEQITHLAPSMGVIPKQGRRGLPQGAQLIPFLGRSELREQANFILLGLRNSRHLQERKPPVIAVSSSVSGEGKSTLVATLAVNMQGRCLIIDADTFRPQQQRIWHLPPSRLEGRDLTKDQLFTEVGQQVDLLILKESRSPEQLAQMSRGLAKSYDLVLIDTAPMLNVADTLALAARIDGLVMVADAQTQLGIVERATQQAEQVGVKILGIVVNRAAANHSLAPYYAIDRTSA